MLGELAAGELLLTIVCSPVAGTRDLCPFCCCSEAAFFSAFLKSVRFPHFYPVSLVYNSIHAACIFETAAEISLLASLPHRPLQTPPIIFHVKSLLSGPSHFSLSGSSHKYLCVTMEVSPV